MQFLGNDSFLEDIARRKQQGTLGRTTLICAPDGCGRFVAAKILAGLFLEHSGHSDMSELTVVEGEGASGEIKIEKIREVRRASQETALAGVGRAVIIKDAHRLNASSANALLKILEEPPNGLLFVLTAKSTADILPTVRSRCAVYTLAPVSDADFNEFLHKQKLQPLEKQLLFCAFRGRIGLLKSFVASKKQRSLLLRASQAVQCAFSSDAYGLLLALVQKGTDDKQAVQCLLLCLAHLFGAAAQGDFTPLSGSYPQANAAVSAVYEAQNALGRNVNQKLVMTLLCEKILEECNVNCNNSRV